MSGTTPPAAPPLTARLRGLGPTVFSEMTALAQVHGAVNLGQGFPDFEGPRQVRQAAIASIERGENQYCRAAGLPALCEAIATHHARFYGLRLDPMDEITVCHGATEAIAATLLAVCDQGDEVVLLEPFYDSYRAVCAMAGAIPRMVQLRDPDFRVDRSELERIVGPRTRAIVVNSPNNPTGKVFDRAELEHVRDVCVRHDLIAITDEVYEHLVYDGEHVPLRSLPGMADRTVMISSTGKSFSFTGWKVGYACASPHLTDAVRTTHQFLTFCSGVPFQRAMASALALPDTYYHQLAGEYRSRRDRLCDGLAELGFGVRVPAGTYFVCADIRPLGFDDDRAFCRALPEQVGVAAIPTSGFYGSSDPVRHLVRFAFCKTDDVLTEGLDRLRRRLGHLRL